MKGKGKNYVNEGFFMGDGGIETEISFGRRQGGKMCLQQYSGLEISRISKCKMGTTVKFWTEDRHEAFKSLQEPTIFSNEICSLKAQEFFSQHLV